MTIHLRRRGVRLRSLQQREQARRRDRIFRDVHVERRKRVLDRRNDRAGGRHAAGFADPLDAERIERRRELRKFYFDVWHFGRARQKIIRQRGGERLGLIVVAHPFEQRIAERVYGASE